MVGYARIYLAQHFFADVYFGSILGTLISILVYVWLNSKRSFLRKYDWADKPITGIIGQ
jgi:membrane-associated phospholipid phosphatase